MCKVGRNVSDEATIVVDRPDVVGLAVVVPCNNFDEFREDGQGLVPSEKPIFVSAAVILQKSANLSEAVSSSDILFTY